MERVLIVGSGASGVHFALSLLRRGYEVLMLDAGNTRSRTFEPALSFRELKATLPDPVSYFLGEGFEAVVYPDRHGEYYGFPPNKSYVFWPLPGFEIQAHGFFPLVSFAQGGLAETWTGGVYPFNEAELGDFPFTYGEIEPFYDEVAQRIGISGVRDDLEKFIPLHQNLLPPLDLDEHSALLLNEYEKHKALLNRELRCYFGRSRIATLSRDLDGRQRCSYLGRCLWGCPNRSFYTPSLTLNECMQYEHFQYISGLYADHFIINSKNIVTRIVARSVQDQTLYEFPVDKLVLAAGTICTSRIFLESIFQNEGKIAKLDGLMDNRQILVPFINLKMVGKHYNPESYQYHQIALGISSNNSKEYIHGLITTLKSSLIHPILQNLPFDLKTSTRIFRKLHASLGLINLNFYDTRQQENYLTLTVDKASRKSTLMINYLPHENQLEALEKAVKTVKRALRKLHCFVPPGMLHVRPMGASVHYAGTLPMSREKRPFTTSADGQSHDFENLFVVDGSTFPFLPAKNITLTLMANAIRVAHTAFC